MPSKPVEVTGGAAVCVKRVDAGATMSAFWVGDPAAGEAGLPGVFRGRLGLGGLRGRERARVRRSTVRWRTLEMGWRLSFEGPGVAGERAAASEIGIAIDSTK